MKSRRTIALKTIGIVVIGSLVCPRVGEAAGGVIRVASPNKPVSEKRASRQGWPNGTLAVVNHRCRTRGWQQWFSGFSSFPEEYEYSLKTDSDLQNLVIQLARVRTPKRRLRLVPGKSPSVIAGHAVRRNVLKAARQNQTEAPIDTTEVYGNRSTNALFTIGTAKMIEAIEQSELPQSEKDRLAPYPTLTVFIDHPKVDVESLKIPKNITVERVDAGKPTAKP